MKGNLHWVTLLVGYLVGSFFGLASVLALFRPRKAATATA